MSWSSPFYEPRLPPIGNSLVNVAEEEDYDGDQEEEVVLMRRHSFPGYVPYTVKLELLARFSSDLLSARPPVQDAECSMGCGQRSVPRTQEQGTAQQGTGSSSSSLLGHSDNSCGRDIAGHGRSNATLPSEVTTLMLQNMPGDVTQLALAKILLDMGFADKFNFLFVHADFITKRSKGFAVINFFSPADAACFVQAWSQKRPLGCCARAGGAVQIVPSHDQGYDAVVAKWAKAGVSIYNPGAAVR